LSPPKRGERVVSFFQDDDDERIVVGLVDKVSE
jgi:hypothetical protein